MSDPNGKTIIVTGAGRGIGFAIATDLAEHGANVVIAEYDPETAATAAASLTDRGFPAVGIQADVRDRAAIDAVVQRTLTEYGRIDGLINNAQISVNGVPFEEHTEEQFHASLESGALGSARFMQAVFPHMKEQGGGSIVNVTSSTSLEGFPGGAGYVASKGAIMAMTRTAAREWGQYRIRVNAYGPSAMTPASEQFARENPEQFQAILAPIPFGRLGNPPTDIAPAVRFLVSDDSAFITGQVFMIDGGQYVSPA